MKPLTFLAVTLAAGCMLGGCAGLRGNPMSDLKEYPNRVTMQGKPLTLLGGEVSVGESAPDFQVVNGQFEPVRLSNFEGKVVVISAVPSLDTGVCSAQTKRFNDEVANLPDNVVVLTLSMDLPFAQARFCEAEKVSRVTVLSDHVEHEFGKTYGVLIKGLGLLARSVFVVDASGKVVYKQVVPELTTHPDYDAVLAAAREAAQ
jgi:thioredoxin-dependent peroxiredoxin